MIYHTPDLEKAREWYTKISGVQPYFCESYYVGFNIYGCELGLDPDVKGGVDGTQSIAYWKVDNIDEAMALLKENGASILQEISNFGEGIRMSSVHDPFGNAIGLIEEKDTMERNG